MNPIYEMTDPDPTHGGYRGLARTDRGNDVLVWTPFHPGGWARRRSSIARPEGGAYDSRVLNAHLAYGTDMVEPSADGYGFGRDAFCRLLFCHGHAFGTDERFGYTVYSGQPIATVLRDEYEVIATDCVRGTEAGDVIVWFGGGQTLHSARLEIVPRNDPAPARVKISSKDGVGAYSHGWMPQFLAEWGDDYRIYRRR